ncbi:DUF2269 family protein [Actinomadura sp. NPDC047616]|uniref:DUF2269 family protein n=1 Tax=Actinomadura sp. NPDC047616 TaxID=3155914 RepID=UPI0033EA8B3B
MTKLLLSVHVLAAILTIGPVAVAASLFPRYAREAAAGERSPGVTAFLHRICRGYTVVGVAVPAFGLATGAQMGVLTDAWLVVSIVLTAIAAVLLAAVILPVQRRLLAVEGEAADATAARGAARLAMATGIFNLLWAVVVVLMIVRPGSTTGA